MIMMSIFAAILHSNNLKQSANTNKEDQNRNEQVSNTIQIDVFHILDVIFWFYVQDILLSISQDN